MTFDVLAPTTKRSLAPYFLVAGLAMLLLFTVAFVFGGADGLGYSFVTNQADFFGLVITLAPFLIGAAAGLVLARVVGSVASINIPIQTGSGPENRRVWIKPFSFSENGDFCSWVENGRTAVVRRSHMCQAGSIGGWYACKPMNRNVSGQHVKYETDNAEATRALLQHRQQRLAEEEAAAMRERTMKRISLLERSE